MAGVSDDDAVTMRTGTYGHTVRLSYAFAQRQTVRLFSARLEMRLTCEPGRRLIFVERQVEAEQPRMARICAVETAALSCDARRSSQGVSRGPRA
jgi:hypothetical protein